VGSIHATPRGAPKPPYTGPTFNSISSIAGVWQNADIFVVGTGTSLKGFDLSRLDNQVTIGLNSIINHMAPNYHLYHDGIHALHFEETQYKDGTVVVTVIENAKIAVQNPTLTPDRILTFVNRGPDVMLHDNDLFVDHTVATAGVQLAWKLGAQRIYLLGVDCYRWPGAKYFWEWDGNERKMIIEPWVCNDLSERKENRNGDMVRDFDRIADEFLKLEAKGEHIPQVLNLSPKSLVRAFPKVDMEAVLSWI
jgi:hypothetical protein